MDIDIEQIPWKQTRYPGISLYGMLRREETGDSVVLIRMDPGCGYPSHRHEGEERVLVLHGGYRDERGEYRTGSEQRNPAGSSHSPVALEGEQPCILLASIEGGLGRS